jgi:ribonuclease BN (tRNA processing enzyme)
MRYGGNTACIEVTDGDQVFIIDAGTGVLQFSQEKMQSQVRFDILLTHLHIDHIQGLGFFKPIFDPDKEVHIWGPKSSSRSLQNRLNRYLSPPLFPVHFRDLAYKLHLHEVSQSDFSIGELKINSRFVNHPGPTVGYRISNSHSVFTYIPDHEPFLGNRGLDIDKKWISGIELAQNADILIHDSQYSEEEYAKRVGWGHCSINHASKFAAIAEVKKLLLFHHDPNHTDQQLEKMYNGYMKDKDFKFDVDLAVEGSVFELG